MTDNPFMTESTAADYLGLAKSTLARWRSCGGVGPTYCKFGGAVRYAKADLDAYTANAQVRR